VVLQEIANWLSDRASVREAWRTRFDRLVCLPLDMFWLLRMLALAVEKKDQEEVGRCILALAPSPVNSLADMVLQGPEG
jgi:hypothetical protein